jgi:proteasome lid subunit RPN8/RPN11
VCIQPHWDAQSGPPYVACLEVSPCDGGEGRSEEIPLKFLADPVRHAVRALVEAGRIAEGAKYTWRVCAFDADPGKAAASERAAFTVEAAPEANEEALGPRRLRDLLRYAVRRGPVREKGVPRDFPVFFARSLLDEAAGEATAAGELETGGVLLGHLSRNADSGDLILEVTAQVPAREAVAEEVSLRFTPQTWQAVHAALRLRRASERIVGWWHSHPRKVWPCHGCAPERRARCPSNRPFFSGMDVTFHRTAFPGPVNLALLLSFQADPAPRHDLFGWRQGLIAARDYYVLEEGR